MTKISVNDRCGDCGFWSAGKCELLHKEVSPEKMPCRHFDSVEGANYQWATGDFRRC